MYCLSVSHKTSNVVVRKKLAFPDEQKKTFLDDLYYSENISECLILCTCNRTEVYFCGDESSVKTVETVLSDFSGIDFDELKKYICLFYGDRALLHLFRVAGGIDSMVIGEDEILGQLKRAYAFAKDNGTVAYELNMCVQAAVACAKKIKTETAISKTRVAIFGIGGVGGYTAEALARSGVGELDLIDDDKVCLTNINRQIFATRKTVGKYKVDVAEERLKDINPDIVINKHRTFYTPETSEKFDFSKYDYVVDAIDTVTGKIELVIQAD